MPYELFDSGWQKYHEGETISAMTSAPEGHLSTPLTLKLFSSLVNSPLIDAVNCADAQDLA
jgi:hypothetical protein